MRKKQTHFQLYASVTNEILVLSLGFVSNCDDMYGSFKSLAKG